MDFSKIKHVKSGQKLAYQPMYQIVGQYQKNDAKLSKAQYLAQLNAKLEHDYQRGLQHASDNAWKGILTYFNL